VARRTDLVRHLNAEARGWTRILARYRTPNPARGIIELVLRDYPRLGVIGRLTLVQSFRCMRLVLWDEARQRLVSLREVRQHHALA
jgi:hypothetical protein